MSHHHRKSSISPKIPLENPINRNGILVNPGYIHLEKIIQGQRGIIARAIPITSVTFTSSSRRRRFGLGQASVGEDGRASPAAFSGRGSVSDASLQTSRHHASLRGRGVRLSGDKESMGLAEGGRNVETASVEAPGGHDCVGGFGSRCAGCLVWTATG